MSKMKINIILFISNIFLICLPLNSWAQAANEITIFAASSLTDAVKEIGNNYQKKTGYKIVYSFASSALLAKQIEAGAKADIIMTADSDWTQYLQSRNLIKPQSRFDLLGGHLVLIAPKNANVNLKIAKNFPIAQYLGAQGKIAIADPSYVPAGKYAQTALVKFGVWDSLQNQIIRTENVRMALNYVAHGEANLGIVYKSDAFVEPDIKIVSEFPDNSHKAIIYPLSLTINASSQAQSFYDYLKSPYAMGVFGRYGFNAAAEVLTEERKK